VASVVFAAIWTATGTVVREKQPRRDDACDSYDAKENQEDNHCHTTLSNAIFFVTKVCP
jgi:hypothetical protein